MAKIWVAPVGKLIEGHVLDCSKTKLTEALKRYDVQLYLKWNKRKLSGHGCWELRRRPEFKSVVESFELDGATYSRLEYREQDIVHHVKDFAFLNYKILEWVQDPRNDTWAQSYKAKDWSKDYEYREAKYHEAVDEKSDEERKYNIKQHRSELRSLMGYINAGGDPNLIIDEWNKLT
jgi:hypothetical protein